ncbi:MAG: hypothetical protein ABIR81_09590 [Ginsengibacter sp.]
MANNSSAPEQQDLPGYPHYPSNEDIMNVKDLNRVSLDVENLSRSQNAVEPTPNKFTLGHVGNNTEPVLPEDDAEDIDDPETAAANLTEDDLIALGEDDSSVPKNPVLDGEDLDIPGAEDDNSNEVIGEEDEENNYYSIGGDAHENLEEDRGTE